MRAGEAAVVVAVLASAVAPAAAEPRLEASGFVGLDWFGDSELGNSWAPEQVPGTAPVLGGRAGWIAVPHLFGRPPADGPGELRGELVVEGELAIATAFTGGTSFGDAARMSYFAPVFGWRAHAMLRTHVARSASLHAVVGGGGATVASSSPFMSKETDPVAYWGLGVQLHATDDWQLRIDLRQGVMPGRTHDVTSTFELQLGLATAFGAPTMRPPPPVVARPEPDRDADRDGDGDGVSDRLDRCPDQRGHGADDTDGCPEPDPDGDGVSGAADACPDVPEDRDRFADDDGCPDPDNDRDGLEDPRDACPGDPETRNGYADDDGCPDTVPAEIARVLAAASAIPFTVGRARITVAARPPLRDVQALLQRHAELRIVIVGHPETAGADDLARRRAEAVKWDLVDQGVTEDRIGTALGGVGTPVITITLATSHR